MTIISDLDHSIDPNFSKFNKLYQSEHLLNTNTPFIFISIARTATKTIHSALGMSLRSAPEPSYYHMSLLDLSTRYYPKLNLTNYFKFAFVRNPFDRLYSLYSNFLNSRNGHTKILQYSRFDRIVNSIYWKSNKDFNLFCKLFYSSDHWKNEVHHRPQLDYIQMDNGVIGVDFVGRYESLEKDWLHISNHLGIQTTLPHINKSIREKNYRNVYNEESIRLITEVYKKDLDQFNYNF